MKYLFGNIILEIQNNVDSSDSTTVLVCPFDGLKSSSELPLMLYRGVKAATFNASISWSRAAASMLGFVIANFPSNSSFNSISLSVPTVDDILKTGIHCFKVRVYPRSSLSEFNAVCVDDVMIEVTNLKTGGVVISGVINPALISKLTEMHSINVKNLNPH